MLKIEQEKVVTKTSAYYNEYGKFKQGPVYNSRKIWEGTKVMTYDYDLEKYIISEVTRVDPEEITFKNEHTNEGSYKSWTAHKEVEETGLPHVYLA